jgi:hypothetical protein
MIRAIVVVLLVAVVINYGKQAVNFVKMNIQSPINKALKV